MGWVGGWVTVWPGGVGSGGVGKGGGWVKEAGASTGRRRPSKSALVPCTSLQRLQQPCVQPGDPRYTPARLQQLWPARWQGPQRWHKALRSLLPHLWSRSRGSRTCSSSRSLRPASGAGAGRSGPVAGLCICANASAGVRPPPRPGLVSMAAVGGPGALMALGSRSEKNCAVYHNCLAGECRTRLRWPLPRHSRRSSSRLKRLTPLRQHHTALPLKPASAEGCS